MQLAPGVTNPITMKASTTFESSVMAPVLAKSLPLTLAPLTTVMEVLAMRIPAKLVFVPSVAEEPTTQKTLELWAPFRSVIVELLAAVVRVLPMRNMKTHGEVPSAKHSKVPVLPNELARAP